MGESKELVRQTVSGTALEKTCLERRTAFLLRLLDEVRGLTNHKELTEWESKFWLEELSPFPLEKVEAAFKQYLRKWRFFPKPADILEILNAEAEQAYHDREAQKTAQLLAKIRADRDYKTLHPESQQAIDMLIQDAVKRMNVMVPPPKRLRIVSPSPAPGRPAVVMSMDEIKARREKEKQEISGYGAEP